MVSLPQFEPTKRAISAFVTFSVLAIVCTLRPSYIFNTGWESFGPNQWFLQHGMYFFSQDLYTWNLTSIFSFCTTIYQCWKRSIIWCFMLERIFCRGKNTWRVGKEALLLHLNSNFLAWYKMARTHPYLYF